MCKQEQAFWRGYVKAAMAPTIPPTLPQQKTVVGQPAPVAPAPAKPNLNWTKSTPSVSAAPVKPVGIPT